jgi:2-polyprenyl-3-methyl-5-hydroxy-6-metoxy-1,4-benzoquinol methylase
MEGRWYKQIPMGQFGPGEDLETWQFRAPQGEVLRQYDVRVTTGKEIDLFSFRSALAKDYVAVATAMRKSREGLFKGTVDRVTECPVCLASTKGTPERLNIYGGRYHQCLNCSHYFVINRPSEEVITEFYSKGSAYHGTYVDKTIVDQRVNQIAIPKAKWIIEQFTKIYGHAPKTILDVGAGAGHFVHACKKLGLEAHGVELSEYGGAFCKEQFGFELDREDITTGWKKYKDIDVVTFWGVIEHVPYPGALMDAAYKILKDRKGIVLCELPNWNCMSTVVQSTFPTQVNRHLEPFAHIQCFTENSAVKVYEQSGFGPAAAWYYGMDLYEMLTNVLFKTGNDDLSTAMAPLMNNAQYIFDRGRLSDLFTIIGVPLKNPIKD